MVLLRRQIHDVSTAERLGQVLSELTDKKGVPCVCQALPVISTCRIERARRAHVELQAIRVPPRLR
jgi:hypothetical protein